MKNMSKISKLIRISALAVATVLVVSGCSKPAPQEKKTEATAATSTAAKEFVPDKPVTLMVNMNPGGSADLLARTIEKVWSKYCPQQVLVVNKPGAGGLEGVTFVSRSKPDGYTLALGYGGGSDLVLPQLQKTDYDPFKALDPVALMTVQPVYFIVPFNSPFNTMKDVIEWAKKENKPITVATGSALNAQDLATRQIAKSTGAQFTAVPHASGGQAVTTLLGGNTVLGAAHTPEIVSQVKDKRVKPLAQSLAGRDPLMPDVPSLKDQGIPVVNIGTVKGIAGPQGMPAEVKAYYDDLFKKIAEDAEFKKLMGDLLQPIVYKNSADFKTFFKQEYDNFGAIIKELGIEKK
jgi:tripartite-type tricarboxylate transporter receptor subunit TctC